MRHFAANHSLRADKATYPRAPTMPYHREKSPPPQKWSDRASSKIDKKNLLTVLSEGLLVSASLSLACASQESNGELETFTQFRSLDSEDTVSGSSDLDSGASPTSAKETEAEDVSEPSGALRRYRHPIMTPAPNGATFSPLNGSAAPIDTGIITLRQTDEFGNSTTSSSVYQTYSTILTADEMLLYNAEIEKPIRPAKTTLPTISHSLSAAIAASDNNDSADLFLTIRKPNDVPIFLQFEAAIAAGQVQTEADAIIVREQLLASKEARILPLLHNARSVIEDLGGTPINDVPLAGLIVATVPYAAIRALSDSGLFRTIELAGGETAEVDQRTAKIGHQTIQFQDREHDGEMGDLTDLRFGQVEPFGAINHIGFRENSGTTSRVDARWSCTTSGCTSVTSFASDSDNHAEAVAGLLFGDLHDGQDSSITSFTSRDVRSSVAGESRGYLIAGPIATSLARAVIQSPVPHVVNLSVGSDTADPLCLGRDTRSQVANTAFDVGVLPIKSAGNEGHADVDDCTVSSPGSAIGAFTVGGLSTGEPGYEGNSTVVRNALVRDLSSRGGTNTEGDGRSIIDITAYACQEHMYDDLGGYGRASCGTSYAAPTVSAAAMAFIDWHKTNQDDAIDDPGFLYTALLLMGDRMTASFLPRISGYSNLYGAGRLKARVFDNAGMDSPWGWELGSTCISQNEVHTVPVNGGSALSTDVDTLYAVAFWFDARHGETGDLDDIDLEIRGTGGTLRRSDTSFDNKAFVIDTDPGGRALELRLVGQDVTADSAGCGSNQMRVYFGFYYEDLDRDDSDGPGMEVEPI